MKKTILFLVSNLVFMTMFSQQVISNGEDTGLGWWQSGSTAVENVDWHPKGGNPSAKSFAIWISTNSDQWSGGGLSGLNINVSDYNTISLLVYKNVTGTVRLELQDGTSNYFVTANYTTAGVWQKLDFPIPSQMGNITTLLIAPFIDYDLSTIVGEQSRCFWDEVIAFNDTTTGVSSPFVSAEIVKTEIFSLTGKLLLTLNGSQKLPYSSKLKGLFIIKKTDVEGKTNSTKIAIN